MILFLLSYFLSCISPLWVCFLTAVSQTLISRQLFLFASAHCKIRNIRGRDNIAASDISSPLFPLQMNTQSIQQWINNERCRTTTLHGPSSSQPLKASLTFCLLGSCHRMQRDLLVIFYASSIRTLEVRWNFQDQFNSSSLEQQERK